MPGQSLSPSLPTILFVDCAKNPKTSQHIPHHRTKETKILRNTQQETKNMNIDPHNHYTIYMQYHINRIPTTDTEYKTFRCNQKLF